jgi:enoyl-CoA hydratase
MSETRETSGPGGADDPGGYVRVVRIGQPDVRNAINSATAERLHDELVAFDADEGARVAVLTGDGSAFCAGANLKDLPRLRDSGPLGPTRLTLSKPVIAAVEGWCVAGGMELAAWCDLRVASEGARFGCLERRWGVPLVDGGTYRLPPRPSGSGSSTGSSPPGPRSTPPSSWPGRSPRSRGGAW